MKKVWKWTLHLFSKHLHSSHSIGWFKFNAKCLETSCAWRPAEVEMRGLQRHLAHQLIFISFVVGLRCQHLEIDRLQELNRDTNFICVSTAELALSLPECQAVRNILVFENRFKKTIKFIHSTELAYTFWACSGSNALLNLICVSFVGLLFDTAVLWNTWLALYVTQGMESSSIFFVSNVLTFFVLNVAFCIIGAPVKL